ncbi:MAG: hypothetical protein ACLVH9_03800 [Fusobacterium sp.]|uniref:hypothetical protein n=1 Tax=Fusobacterium sp. TaxID=68766 RepID=UPI00399BAC65
MRTYILTVLFLIANTLSFAEIPHSYVTENPKKEVQKVETFKQREKAELNLSVTKLKTKEIEGKLVNGKLVFDITDKKDIQEGNILVTQGTPYKPNNARVRSANPTQILEATKEANRLEVTGENLQNVYVNILDNKGQLVGIYKNIKKDYLKSQMYLSGNLNYELTDEYIGGYIYDTYNMNYSSGKGYKFISGGSLESGYETMSLLPQLSNVPQGADHGSWLSTIKINKKTIFNSNLTADIGVINAVIDENLEIELKQINRYLALKLDKFPQEDFTLTIEYDGKRDFGGYSHTNDGIYWDSDYRNYHGTGYINFKFKATTLKGNSTLTFAEYYPVNEFIQFTANPTIQNAQPLALDNSVRDVTLETTGKGLVAIQQGDKLTVDGHQVVIGAGGNIGLQKLTIGNVKYTYEVKNGKFRIALNEWGVLEPNRTIHIKIVRTENGKDKSLAEHNLTIKAPRRVEGTSNIKLNQDYSIRNIIRFSGVSLEGAGALGLENPIPLGVSLTSTAGQGIPFMKEGDRLEISDGLTTRSTYSTRGVKAFTIGPNGTLGKQQVKLNNGELTVFVEGGKLRVGVNNWLVNNTINSNVRLVRGTNEIMNHTLDIKVPEAPFNIKKNGLLDFGNVTAGSKRTAETDIVLEMLKDVSDVKFSLKDPQPMLENLGTGDNLKVNRIEYLVSKQGKKDYKVKLKGNLTIPENTKSGLYTGSTVLELQIK